MIQERVEITSAVNFCVGFRSVGEQSEAGDSRLTVNSCGFFRFVREQSEEGETEDSRVKKMHQETADATMTVNSTTGRDVSLAGIATSITFVATKHVFCRDKSMLVVTKVLSRKY